MPAVFIAQSTLTEWSDAGKIRVEDTTLVLIREQRTVDLIPAVRFTALEFGDEDPNKLLGKVKTSAQLKEMGAEHMAESVIYGEMAYKVVEGFMGDLAAQKPMKPIAPAATAEPAPAPEPERPAAATTPAPVDMQPQLGETADDDDAAALSKLFLDTVR